MSHIAQRLDAERNRLHKFALRDIILTRIDLINATRPLADIGCSIAVTIVTADSEIRNSMSFAFHERNLIVPNDNCSFAELQARIKDNCFSENGIHSQILISRNAQLDGSEARVIAEIADIVFASSLRFRNIARDDRAKLIEKLRSKLDSIETRSTASGPQYPDLQLLKAFIEDELYLITDVVQLNPNDSVRLQPYNDMILREAASIIVEDIRLSRTVLTAIESGKPFDVVIPGHQNRDHVSKALVIPLRSYVDPGLKKTEALVITRDDGELPSHETVNSINRCIDLYLARKYRLNQTQTLAQFFGKLEAALLSPALSGYTEFSEKLKKSVGEIARAVVGSTAAYSMAVLEYLPHENGLKRFDVYDHPSSPRHGHQPDDEIISLGDASNRVSAFAFVNAHALRRRREPYCYIDDVRKIPEKYRQLGLRDVVSARHSASEIAIPIWRGDLVLGVVNFEAESRYAFDSDREFLQAVVSGISSLITSYYQSSDERWLLDNAHVIELFHQARSNMRSLAEDMKRFEAASVYASNDSRVFASARKGLESLLSILKDVLERGRVDPDLPRVRLRHTIDNVRRNYISDTTHPEICDFSNVSDCTISQMHSAGISIILKNLIQNIYHGARDDSLIITTSEIDGGRRTLRILMQYHNWQETALLDLAFVSPIRKGDAIRHGLYMVGVVTRALRGTLSFTRYPIRAPTPQGIDSFVQLDIEIPLVEPFSAS